MRDLAIFNGMSNDDITIILKSLAVRKVTIKKDRIIFSNLKENEFMGIMLSGTAKVIKYDYCGNRNIIDNIYFNDIFGQPFFYNDGDVSIVATSDCEILLLDYYELINNYEKYKQLHKNINNIFANKVNDLYERVEILSKRSIREKLLCYFSIIVKKIGSKSFNMPITYIELADYLSVDRSAMMRELKKLKDDGLIISDGKKISIRY